MRLLGIILVACIAMAAMQALVTVLIVASIALLCYGIAFQPRETLAVIGTLACWSLLLTFPGVALGLLVLFGLLHWWRDQPC